MYKISVTFKDGEFLLFEGENITTNDMSKFLIISNETKTKNITAINMDEIRYYKIIPKEVNNG